MLLKGITTIMGETTPPSFTPLLDTYSTGIKLAYSLRRLRSSATYAVRVRRSSDNAEQDIGFAGEHLDTATLLSFVGASDGYVVTLYDQSGNGVHMNQTAIATAQKKIVSAGALIQANSRPAGFFDGVNDFYACAAGSESYFTFLHDGTLTYMFSIAQYGLVAEPETAYAILANTSSSTARGIFLRYDDRTPQSRSQAINMIGGNGSSGVVNALLQNLPGMAGVLHQGTHKLEFANATVNERYTIRINGGAENKSNTAAATPSALAQTVATRIGALPSGANYMHGYIPELIIYTGDQSAMRATIENNQRTYFNIS